MRFFAILLAALALLGVLGFFVADSAARGVQFETPTLPGRELPQGGFFVGDFPTVEHLNPFTTDRQVPLGFVLRYTHDSLLRLDEATGTVEPSIARLVRSSEDQLTHVFELCDDRVFSDGKPVTVADVKFTFDVSRDPSVEKGALHDVLHQIASLTVAAPKRIRVVLKTPHFNGIVGVAVGFLVLQKQWFLDQVAIRARELGQPVPAGPGAPGFGKLLNEIRLPGPGTGPYQLARDSQGQPVWAMHRELWLVQNIRSWHRAAYPRRWNLGGLGLNFVGGEPLTRLKTEQTDWSLPANPGQFLAAHPELKDHYRVLTYDLAANGPFFVAWNCARLAPGVRRALARLFDREYIRKDILGGSAQVVDSFFRPTDPEYPRDPEPVQFSVAGAREDLAGLGYGPDGKPLTVRIVGGVSERNRRILDRAQHAFRDAGVTLKASLLKPKALQAVIDKGEFDGWLLFRSIPKLAVDPYSYFHSAGVLNDSRYANPEVDALLVEARREADITRRAAIYHRLHKLVQRDQPVTILVRPINTLLLHRRFQGVKLGPFGAVPFNWWVAAPDRLYPRGRAR